MDDLFPSQQGYYSLKGDRAGRTEGVRCVERGKVGQKIGSEAELEKEINNDDDDDGTKWPR